MRAWLALAVILPVAASAQTPAGCAGDALAVDAAIAENYAYPERLKGGVPPASARLDAERAAVRDRRSLIRYAERRLLTLADHHAITGAALGDSWALVPSFADLWIERDATGFAVDAVREGSPAAQAGAVPGDRLVAVADLATEAAVAAFWADLGVAADPAHAGFAARVLAAGRRDRPRVLTLRGKDGRERRVTLDSLYAHARPQREPVTLLREKGATVLRINDSLGDDRLVAAFDTAMAQVPAGGALVLDLTDTPSGGNTTQARAILGWFVDRPTGYQLHRLPAEERRTGIARQWVEQVLPRPGKRHRGRLSVRVGRWTGSMGEGLAIGLDAIGATVRGGRMAGLLGAIYEYPLPSSGLRVKLPAERLASVRGVPREAFVPGRRSGGTRRPQSR